MKEPTFYIEKTEDLINRLNEFKENTFSSSHSLEKMLLETEILFFGYSENYPSLLDIKQIKERYNGLYYDFEGTIAKKLILLLTLFKTFINDNKPYEIDYTKKVEPI